MLQQFQTGTISSETSTNTPVNMPWLGLWGRNKGLGSLNDQSSYKCVNLVKLPSASSKLWK